MLKMNSHLGSGLSLLGLFLTPIDFVGVTVGLFEGLTNGFVNGLSEGFNVIEVVLVITGL